MGQKKNLVGHCIILIFFSLTTYKRSSILVPENWKNQYEFCKNIQDVIDKHLKKNCIQRSKLSFSSTRLLATFFSKLVAKAKILVARKKRHVNEKPLNVSLHEGQMVRLRTFPKCLRLNIEFKQEKTKNDVKYILPCEWCCVQLRNQVCCAPFIYFS